MLALLSVYLSKFVYLAFCLSLFTLSHLKFFFFLNQSLKTTYVVQKQIEIQSLKPSAGGGLTLCYSHLSRLKPDLYCCIAATA